jgi:hypothetical protein
MVHWRNVIEGFLGQRTTLLMRLKEHLKSVTIFVIVVDDTDTFQANLNFLD